MTDGQKTPLTRSTYERLQAELEDLRTRGRVEIARAIAAKDQQGKMEARIRQIEATLANCEVVDDLGTSDKVAPGTVVSIRYEGDDEVERYLVGSIEEQTEGVSVVSPASPLGQALLGRGPGETVEYEAPGGTLRVEIVAVGQ
ncbi:GreA/GreB family elongation factor [Aciditerrimonas ferrireducens]|uniref:GreA/GreB family elongation factor n=1 Tax=Aciditerrimonas ferrireducens TaxID=667306 RepID=UPI002006B848|nr:transcription elongation factor GreA [Aciditerrimonas ferrireducens]MCK4176846.1 transcription elongation factor GreA [Aciditerrimonas ferrireducens]